MARTVIDILEELEQTAGSNAKKDILQAARGNDLLKRVFAAAQDPYTVYYVNKFKMPKPGPSIEDRDILLRKFLEEVLPKLSSRQVTGNDAKALVTSAFSNMDDLVQKWCQRILIHNLRCGVQESTVNKVWPGLIKSFSVALAYPLKSEFTRGEGIKILETVRYPVRVEPKLDGLRCIAVKKDGEVTFYTRNGTVLETLPRIKKALEKATYDNVVLDGEAMGSNWNESASVVMSSKSKKDDSNIVYNVFDAVPLADWVSQTSSMSYSDRCELLVGTVLSTLDFDEATPSVRLVPHITAKDESELKKFFAKCMNEGYEGVMLKTMDTSYQWDRTRNILKLKPCVTYEGVVVGSYEGRRGTKREGQFGGFYVLLPNKVITRVGGGFNDALRAQVQLEDPPTWNGKIVEVEAQPDPLTKDGLTEDGKMRFPVFTRTREESDVDRNIPATWEWWQSLEASDRASRIKAVSRVSGEDED